MDKKYQNAIKDVLIQSDMSDYVFIRANVYPIRYEEQFLADGKPNPYYDPDNPYLYTKTIELRDVLFAKPSKLTNAWVANNILIFELFDGWLEERYSLEEGESFKKRLDNLKALAISELDIMAFNLYRILRIIRNGIQHNLSGVEHDDDGYHVAYKNRQGTEFYLEFNEDVTRYLYTLCICLVQGYVEGVIKAFRTKGHYVGMLAFYYDKILSGVSIIEDDLMDIDGNILPLDGLSHHIINPSTREVICNPIKRCEDEACVTFAWFDTEMNRTIADYLIQIDGCKYLLPEEIGTTDVTMDERDDKRRREFSIRFDKSLLCDLWMIEE